MKVTNKELVSIKEFPAISVILPTHPGLPEKLNLKQMEKIISRLEERLNSQYSKAQSKAMIAKLKKVAKEIDYKSLSEGLAVFVSPNVEKVINLPFAVSSEKVMVDETFEVRDVIRAIKFCRDCLIAVISHNKVKTYLDIECEMNQVSLMDMPDGVKDVTNEHSLPGWDYFDTKSWEEKNLLNYIRFIDNTIQKEIKSNKLNVIVLGDKKLLGHYRKITQLGDRIIGYIEGNYEHSNPAELKKLILPVIEKENKRETEYAMKLLEESIDANNYAAGISQVWRSAVEGRGRLLIVEMDYKQSAVKGNDNYTISIAESGNNPWNFISDAVDDIMQVVIKNKGDVVFVENGSLKEYQHIVLINRY